MLIRNKFNGFSFDGSRRAYIGGGGGGGGGQQPAPSSQRVEQTSIPDYARPYVESMLGRTAALTDINQNPYQPYAGQRVAGFTPMQAQGFGNVANQQVASQIGLGSNLAETAGMGQVQTVGDAAAYGRMGYDVGQQGQGIGQQAAGLAPDAQSFGRRAADFGELAHGASGKGFGAGERFEGMATSPNAQQSFMSPYMQNVVDFQKQGAIRDFDIAQQGRNAQAVGKGAFGGSRAAVVDAEANRALMNQLGGIQATGTQQAFKDAQDQMKFGADLGLRGLGAGFQGIQTGIQGQQAGLQGLQGAQEAFRTGLQGTAQGLQGANVGLSGVAARQAGFAGANQAGQLLGQLGASQFAQQRDITNDMMRAGAVQQGQQQQGLDVAYQDFTKAQNYPYQQLAFGSDMIRGLPLSQAAQSQYTAPPNAASQLGGLGTTALGIYGMSGGFGRANGGIVGKGYANGGLMDIQNYRDGGEISSLNVEQLTKMLENPRLDPMERAEIEQRIMLLTRMASNPEAAGIMVPRQQTAGIDAIPTGDMVPEQMAGGGIVAFSEGGNKGVNSIKSAAQSRQSYRDRLERESADYMERASKEDPFKESRALEAAIRSQIAESRGTSPYEALAMTGLKTMQGTSPNFFANVGAGGEEGLQFLSRSKQGQANLQNKLLEQGVEREKSKFGRETQLQQSRDAALGRIYNKEASLAASAAAAGDPEYKALAKAQALANNDPVIKGLVKQQKDSGAQPGTPDYQYYEDRIAERNSQIFTAVGLKPPPVQESKIKPPAAPVKEPSFLDRINPFSSSKPAASQNKVVPFNQLPN